MKIGIVEDELIIADSLSKILCELGYTVTEPAISYVEAVEMLEEEKPDLVLLDIQLRGTKDGIDVARFLNEHYPIPFIFLTANSDSATVARAKEVRPPAFLVKPFTRDDLYTSIEICLSNFGAARPGTHQKLLMSDVLFIKEGTAHHKINLQDIIYLESDHVYINIVTTDRKYLVRASLQDYAAKLEAQNFVRVHRSYLVNFSKVEKIDIESLLVNGREVPLSKTYRDLLMQQLNIK